MSHKKKIRSYLENKGISMAQFSRKLNLSESFLKQGDYFGSEKIKIICFNFPDLNLNWLIFDKGPMILQEGNSYEIGLRPEVLNEPEVEYVKQCSNCAEKDKRMEMQERFITNLEANNQALIQQLNGKG